MADLWRKKTSTVQANELTKENAEAVAVWCGGVLVKEFAGNSGTDDWYVGINVPTRRGMQRASEGDYVVQGEQGDFYPSRAASFHAEYEKII